MATVQLLHHKINISRTRLSRLNNVDVNALITFTQQLYVRLLSVIKPGSKQLADMMLEGLVQNLFGPHVSKSFMVILLQSYFMPVLQITVCRIRRFAMLNGLVAHSRNASSPNPCCQYAL